VTWLAEQLHQHLLGALTGEISVVAQLTQSEPYREVRDRIHELKSALAEASLPSVA